jgi:alanine racemase
MREPCSRPFSSADSHVHTTYATIDLAALGRNLSGLQRRLHPDCTVMAVVKANAYGHGAVNVSRALVESGITRLAVASLQEGMALRQAGITAHVLVLADLFDEHWKDLVAYRLTPVISDHRLLESLARVSKTIDAPLAVHLKVDTGMGRLGFSPTELEAAFDALPAWKGLRVEGLMTHLADSDGQDVGHTERQLELFNALLDQAKRRGITIPIVHAANSAALIRFRHSHFSLVRPGLALYGYHTLPDGIHYSDLKPILSLRSKVMQIRKIKPGDSISYNRTFLAKRASTIAVLPIGYADGYSRRLSNTGAVLIKGRRAPIVGLVCMDMTMVDVTDIPSVQVGDAVTLIGADGDNAIWADDIARWTGTIPYEILCAIGPRISRVYQQNAPGPNAASAS